MGVAFEPSVPELIEIFSGTVGFVGGNRCSADAMSRCTDPLRWQQYWQTSQYRANLWLCWLGWWPTIRILALPLLKKSSQRCVPSWWMVSGWSSHHHHHQHNHYHQPLGASTVSQPNAWRPSTELTSTPSTQEPHRWGEGSPEKHANFAKGR